MDYFSLIFDYEVNLPLESKCSVYYTVLFSLCKSHCTAENSFVVCRRNISIVNDILFIEVQTMFLFTQYTIHISE